jgi:dihydroorotate dehydrogenase electron transfer subunit
VIRACEEARRMMGVRITELVRPAEGYAVLRTAPPGPLGARPGQFAMLRAPGVDVTLHRPMSILSAGESLDFLIRDVGPGSRGLTRLEPGDPLELIAPLGRPFPPPRPGAREVLVAGGVGASPLLFHARESALAGVRPHVIYGGRSASDLVLARAMAEAADLEPVTEDGSAGLRGLATDPLARLLGRGGVDRVLACGPLPMMHAAARACALAGVACLVCLEALMACGFGACLGCAVPAARGGYLYVCTDGPVMDARDVDWERLLAAQ